MDASCKDEIDKLTNSMNSDKRKEIAKVKAEKDDEKKKEKNHPPQSCGTIEKPSCTFAETPSEVEAINNYYTNH